MSQATGNLGSHILKALNEAGFTVTAIQRAQSKNIAAGASKSLKVDLSSGSALVKVFKDQDVVVSAVPNPKLSDEKVWMDAAISAGVTRIVPSEFSSNLEMGPSRKLPIVKDKIEVRDYVESIADKIEWTSVNNGPFFEPWLWIAGFLGPNVKTKTVTFHDGGDNLACTTTLEQIAKGVAQALKHPEQTRNKPIYVHSVAMSERKMYDIVKKITGMDFQEKNVSIDAVIKDTQEAMDKGDMSTMMNWYLPFIFRGEYGCDFRNSSANKMLGLKEMDEEELENAVRSKLKDIHVV